MHWQAMQFVTSLREFLPGFFYDCSVQEVGSYVVNDSVREIFLTNDYIGIDLCEGPGVDVVARGDVFHREKLFDVVISFECFEHNPQYLETFQNMYGLLKEGGLFIFTCATTGRPEHGTERTDPSMSPGTSSVGVNYYKNLTEKHFSGCRLDEKFDNYSFYNNNKSCDLYFVGVKSYFGERESVRLPLEKIGGSVAIFQSLSNDILNYFNDDSSSGELESYLLCPQFLYHLYLLGKKSGRINESVFSKIQEHSILWQQSGTFSLLAAELLIDKKDYWKALAYLYRAGEQLNDTKRISFLKGCCYESMGCFSECIAHWKKISKNGGGGLNLRIGQACEKLGLVSQAMEYYKAALSVEPENPIFIYRSYDAAMKQKGNFLFDPEVYSLFLRPGTPRWILNNLLRDYGRYNSDGLVKYRNEIDRLYEGVLSF